MALDKQQIDSLKGMMAHGELVFIGCYSDANRPIEKIEGEWMFLNNGNKVNLCYCEPEDFGILTRIQI